MTITAEQLKEALVAATLADFQGVSVEREIEYTFSEGFEKWAAGLLRQMRSGKRYVSTAGRVLRAILIAAIIAALLAGTAMAFPAVREAVKKFFIRSDGNMQYIEFYVNGTDSTETGSTEATKDGSIPGVKDEIILDVEVENPTGPSDAQTGPPIPIEYRFPIYLPEGMQITSEVVNPITISTTMSGPGGLICDYRQMALPNGSNINTSIGLGSDYVHSEKVICNIVLDYFSSNVTDVLIWTDEFYLYRLVVNADMPMEEIEKIISSIEPRDDLNNP